MTSPDPTNRWFTPSCFSPALPGAENHDDEHEPIDPTSPDDLQRLLQGLRKL